MLTVKVQFLDYKDERDEGLYAKLKKFTFAKTNGMKV